MKPIIVAYEMVNNYELDKSNHAPPLILLEISKVSWTIFVSPSWSTNLLDPSSNT